MNMNKKIISPFDFTKIMFGSRLAVIPIGRAHTDLTTYQRYLMHTAQKLNQSGQHVQARALIESANILDKEEKANDNRVRKRKLESMIESHDFDTFKEKVAETPMAKIIDTKEKFEALVESHSLRQEGKEDEAKGVLEYVGLKPLGRNIKHSVQYT